MREVGTSQFNKKTNKMEYFIKEYRKGEKVKKIMFETHDEYIKECYKRGFMFSTDPIDNEIIKKEIEQSLKQGDSNGPN